VRSRGGGTLALLLAGLAAAAPEAATQERPERPVGPLPAPAAARGWLGIEFHWEQVRGREGPALIIRQVMPGSPAERAELRAGDRVRSFGGIASDPISVQARAARLRPGDTITLEVMRPPEGRTRQVTVQADERPAMVAMGPGGEWLSFSPDTLQVRLRVNMDSIRTEMDRQLRQAEARIVMVRRLAEEARREGEAVRRVWGEGDFVAFRTGQRVVAGAEVTPLNPDLARYFGTESGVLTVEVLEDTPAARGGLRGGDVIVRVGDEGVSSVAQLRTALELGYRSPPVPVTVIREGREVQLLLPR
jgi:S1-C subfamily serine protease